jgi:hypothetical protein
VADPCKRMQRVHVQPHGNVAEQLAWQNREPIARTAVVSSQAEEVSEGTRVTIVEIEAPK